VTRKRDIVPVTRIERTIRLIRGERVLLDADLATLYGVDTGALVRAVKRNVDRFPADFMFQLTKDEIHNLRCQFGISSLEFGTSGVGLYSGLGSVGQPHQPAWAYRTAGLSGQGDSDGFWVGFDRVVKRSESSPKRSMA